jgi:hypothetical protein
MSKITAIVHTRDSEATLERCLRSVSWCDSILVADMASVDSTVEMARGFGATVLHCDVAPWSDVIRNSVANDVTTEWTLVLDSDEYLADDAEEFIRGFVNCAPRDTAALALPRRNIFFGSFLSNERWYPDHQVRVFRTGSAHWVSQHHVGAIVNGQVERGPLDGPHIYHDAYESVAAFATKQLRYAATDDYDRPFDPGEYVGTALRIWMEDHESDDRARAVDLMLAWNELYRCLFHWAAVRDEGAPLPVVLQMPPFFVMTPLTSGRHDEGDSGNHGPDSDVSRSTETLRAVARRVRRLIRRW